MMPLTTRIGSQIRECRNSAPNIPMPARVEPHLMLVTRINPDGSVMVRGYRKDPIRSWIVVTP